MMDIIQSNSDILLTISSIVFSISLLPQIIYNLDNKICEIPYKTSVLTAIFMAVVVLVYISNGFILSTITGSATTVAWIIIAIQRYKYK